MELLYEKVLDDLLIPVAIRGLLIELFLRQIFEPRVIVAHDVLTTELARRRNLTVHFIVIDCVHRVGSGGEVQADDLDRVSLAVDVVDGLVDLSEAALADLPHV